MPRFPHVYFPTLRPLERQNDRNFSVFCKLVKIGWGEVSERKAGLKYFRESSFRALISSSIRQNSITFSLHSFLNTSLVGGFSKIESGCGNWYWTQIFLICWNQELQVVFASTSISTAIERKIFLSRRLIIPNNDSWRRWRRADPGSDPARKYTTQSGVFSWSFNNLSKVFLKCWVISDISHFLRMTAAKPERRTGCPCSCSTRRQAAGFPW